MSDQLTPEIIAELRAKHSEMTKVVIGDEVFVIRPPSRAEWERFEDQRGEQFKSARANLVRFCVVFPEDLDAVLNRRPAAIINLLDEVSKVGGFAEKVRAEKL